MGTSAPLRLDASLPLCACNAGLFVSRGMGTHPDRVINSYELIFVRKGLLSMREEDRDFEIAPGQTLVLWPGRRHKGTQSYPADLSFYWIHFEVLPRGAANAAAKTILEIPQHATLRRDDRLAELFHRFLDDQETGALQPVPAALLILLMLCEVAAAHRAESGPPSDAAAALAARAQRLIQTRFHEPISTIDIADALSCNADYLGRVFRKTFARTLVDEIHEVRLRNARRLLLDSALNVDQISRQCGFHDSGYFRRVFRKRQGLAPRAFRQLYARAHVNTE